LVFCFHDWDYDTVREGALAIAFIKVWLLLSAMAHHIEPEPAVDWPRYPSQYDRTTAPRHSPPAG
jgi:hypothetical protein